MDSKSYRTMAALLWLALPLTAVQFWTVWNKLPARMASHFGAAGQPNGWMSRETLAIFSWVADFPAGNFYLGAYPGPQTGSSGLVAARDVLRRAGVLLSVNSSVLNCNLYGRPLNIVPELVVVFVAAFLVIGVGLSAKRGPGFAAPNRRGRNRRNPRFSSVGSRVCDCYRY